MLLSSKDTKTVMLHAVQIRSDQIRSDHLSRLFVFVGKPLPVNDFREGGGGGGGGLCCCCCSLLFFPCLIALASRNGPDQSIHVGFEEEGNR